MIIPYFQAKYPLSYNQFSTEKINIVSLQKSQQRKIALLMQLAVSTTTLGISVLESIKPPNLTLLVNCDILTFIQDSLCTWQFLAQLEDMDNEHSSSLVESIKFHCKMFFHTVQFYFVWHPSHTSIPKSHCKHSIGESRSRDNLC